MLNPRIAQYDTSKIGIKLDGSFLNRFPPSIIHSKIVNIYLVYEIINFHCIDNYPTLTNALCGSVKLTKNADIDEYKYSAYGIGFDGKGYYSIGNEIGRNVIIFGVNMDSSPFSDNKGKYILILGKSPTQGLGEHSLTAEKMYFISFSLLYLAQIFGISFIRMGELRGVFRTQSSI